MSGCAGLFPSLAADDELIAARFDSVVRSLAATRVRRAGLEEVELHELLSTSLYRAGIAHQREHVFAQGCRADLWCDGVVIEVKKSRPDRTKLLLQVEKYARQSAVLGIVVVLERSIQIGDLVCGKPVKVISLNQQWGISL